MNLNKMMESKRRCKIRAYNNHVRRLKEKCFSVSERLQYIRFSNRKLNCLRWHNNESREHILKKLDICIELKNMNHIFITEAIFVDGGRADIIDLTSGIIYEIMNSENEKDCDEKVKNYPKEFRIVKLGV